MTPLQGDGGEIGQVRGRCVEHELSSPEEVLYD